MKTKWVKRDAATTAERARGRPSTLLDWTVEAAGRPGVVATTSWRVYIRSRFDACGSVPLAFSARRLESLSVDGSIGKTDGRGRRRSQKNRKNKKSNQISITPTHVRGYRLCRDVTVREDSVLPSGFQSVNCPWFRVRPRVSPEYGRHTRISVRNAYVPPWRAATLVTFNE